MTMQIRSFSTNDEDAVIELWELAGVTRPWNDPRLDIARKMAVQPELFLVAVEDHNVVGSVMAGYDGHRGWLYYLATAPLRRGRGYGHALVAEAEERLLAMGCPKVQLMVRRDNDSVRGFYENLGYEATDVWLAGKRLRSDARPT